MKIQEINVLVDGYNLEMVEGTGIKTYGVTLIKALTSLGINVDILCSRNSNNKSNSKNLILNEALFFDRPSDKNNISKAKIIFFAAIQKFYHAQEIPVSDFVIKQNADYIFDYLTNSGKIFNLNDCYKITNNVYKLFQITTKINIKRKIDILHATYPLPIRVNNAKKITTIHDLIPLKLPHTTLDDKKFFFNLVKDSIKDSALIITISENTKKDILHCFDIHPDKIHLTYQPIIDNSLLITDDLLPIFLKKYKLRLKKYILFVGSIEPKKNLGRLIDAYSRLDTEMQLVIVGKKGWLWEGEIGKVEAIFGKGFAKKVKFLEYVTRQDLSYLYKGAFCFVFPSLYEGFGLPPLEAMSLGCPVITSNVASLPEVCGNAAIYVDPYNSEEIRQAIEKLMNDPDTKAQLIEAGKERVEFFSMENYSKKLHDAYTNIL
ncbi:MULTISPECIES: glycosyltransferase family 4 protein [Cyanophyceae]|uniref:glycosyltransferase family 4 protein n=1 Tax=Cyanophyceae TaxID=3028117 RepID=UPI00232BF7B8|nr:MULTISPECIES: glycosyltransferase family 1 protein [Cyanophyceae]MDB9358343.1 glycosyltransferase family 1 protein [Nodularia spumigena CS-587/03]MDB9319773.1 glycosyltransferase family 1 protein [Nodularia spumigena CS-590/01A]MDB9323790.1 glycosyltransferase family 1 protein [Nodularia spumigena CS-591/07A]MDB9324675.1 glycosyltransferase family 1 protein [Nodularia spumigena CS-590/02]MDB9331827.1 glycosyltransferase family 1 protein [Nodularia spumigena CS-591/04]